MTVETPDEIADILRQLEWGTEKFPREALEAAVARREEIAPHLLKILEETGDYAAKLDAEGDYMAHLYAMYLLAQFRDTRAYPLVVRLASLPGDLLESLCGDFITEDLGRVLASVSGGDLSGMQSLVENENADEWARGAALSGLVTLIAAGQVERTEIVDYFATLFRGKLPRQASGVWDALVCCACDIYPEELLADIERAYDDDLVDPQSIGIEDVRADLARGREETLARLARTPGRSLMNDAVSEIEWLANFEDIPQLGESDPDDPEFDEFDFDESDLDEPPSEDPVLATPTTVRYATPKVGRNEPCPCGSGKKYKKCCGS